MRSAGRAIQPADVHLRVEWQWKRRSGNFFCFQSGPRNRSALGGARLDDPKAYTKPFDAIIYSRIMPTSQLSEFVCIDKDAAHYIGQQQSQQK